MHTTGAQAAPMYTADAYTAETHDQRAPGLSDDAYWQMTEAAIELRRQEAAEAKAYDAGSRARRDAFEAKLRAVIGEKQVAAYHTERQRLRAVLREARKKITLDPRTRKEFDTQRRSLVAESRTFAATLGVDVAAVARLAADTRKAMDALFDQTVGRGENPPPARTRAKNKTFNPPFSGSRWSALTLFHYGDSSDVISVPTFSKQLSFQTGEIGSTTHCSCTDASDYDDATCVVRTAMRQWYQMPAEGQVRVSNTLEVINSHYSGSVYDEWGWSDVDVKQGVRYYAQVTSPSVSSRVYYYPISGWQHEVTDEDANPWSANRWGAGSIEGIFQQIVIPGVFAKGTWVLVDVGVENTNTFVTNDTEVTSDQTAHFWTKDIGISSTGSP